jgi:hypothetical protein
MASTDARPVPKKNVAYRHYFCIRKNDGSIITSWTGADTEISEDGATMGDATNEAVEIATNSGCGYVELTASEMNNDCVVLKVTVTNTDAIPYVVSLFPEEDGDLRATLSDSAQGGTSMVLTAERIVVASTTTNEPAMKLTGDGSGEGLESIGGATGSGARFTGSGGNGHGIVAAASGLSANGIDAQAQGASGSGFYAAGPFRGLYMFSSAGIGFEAISTTGTGGRFENSSGGDGLVVVGGSNDITADITGNLSGSVGSVTGAVGSVTGAVGSVTGNVGGNVVGSTASVSGAVGSVTGNVGGNVTGSVGSVVGHTAQTGDTYALANGANGFVALKAETALIVADTNELQGDWANDGRLDVILDARASQTTADAIETDTQDIQSRLPAALVSGRMSSDAVAISGSTAASDQLEASATTIVSGTAQTGTLSTTQMTSDLSEATDDHYIGRIIIWTSGVLANQATDITDYAGSSGLLTFTAVTEAPSNNDTFIIV